MWIEVPDEKYVHYKSEGKLYQMIGTAWDTKHDGKVIVYQPLYPCEHKFFTRPVEEFFGSVCVDGVHRPRFELVP